MATKDEALDDRPQTSGKCPWRRASIGQPAAEGERPHGRATARPPQPRPLVSLVLHSRMRFLPMQEGNTGVRLWLSN